MKINGSKIIDYTVLMLAGFAVGMVTINIMDIPDKIKRKRFENDIEYVSNLINNKGAEVK